MAVAVEAGAVHYLSSRRGAAFAATYRPSGPPERARPGSLEHFLVERYRLFSERNGRLVTAIVTHEPWPLQLAEARIDLNRMAPPGIDFRGAPLVHFARSVDARISAPVALPRTSAAVARLGVEAIAHSEKGLTLGRKSRPSRIAKRGQTLGRMSTSSRIAKEVQPLGPTRGRRASGRGV